MQRIICCTVTKLLILPTTLRGDKIENKQTSVKGRYFLQMEPTKHGAARSLAKWHSNANCQNSNLKLPKKNGGQGCFCEQCHKAIQNKTWMNVLLNNSCCTLDFNLVAFDEPDRTLRMIACVFSCIFVSWAQDTKNTSASLGPQVATDGMVDFFQSNMSTDDFNDCATYVCKEFSCFINWIPISRHFKRFPQKWSGQHNYFG